jgi:hypothetical protein
VSSGFDGPFETISYQPELTPDAHYTTVGWSRVPEGDLGADSYR